MLVEVINYLLDYKNLHIVQDTDMFHFSLDSVLLPNFITIHESAKNILDIGCGNAPIPLILSTKTKAHIDGVEIQKKVFDMAVKSVEINQLSHQIRIYHEDIHDFYQNVDSEKYDIITCNPPFFKVHEHSNLNDNEYKTIARHEVKLNIDDILKISRKLLKNSGTLGIVHRPDRLLDLLDAFRKNNIEPKKIQFVYPKKGREANILLIEGKKNGKPGLKILPPLYSHNEDGSYTEEIQKMFESR